MGSALHLFNLARPTTPPRANRQIVNSKPEAPADCAYSHGSGHLNTRVATQIVKRVAYYTSR